MTTNNPCAITTGIRYVTPDEAKQMLSNLYHRQRPLNRGHMLRVSADMAEGRFQLCPDPVVILRDGRVVNGQHRLRAIVESGTTQAMMVSCGWEEGVYDIMDAGLRRALSLRVEQPWLRHKNGIGAVRSRRFVAACRRHVKQRDGRGGCRTMTRFPCLSHTLLCLACAAITQPTREAA